MTNDLRPITLEYIKELRASGQSGTASDLLKAYHESRIKGRETDKRMLKRHQMAKEQALKKHYGICRHWGCENPADENRVSCAYHRAKMKEYNTNKKSQLRS